MFIEEESLDEIFALGHDFLPTSNMLLPMYTSEGIEQATTSTSPPPLPAKKHKSKYRYMVFRGLEFLFPVKIPLHRVVYEAKTFCRNINHDKVATDLD